MKNIAKVIKKEKMLEQIEKKMTNGLKTVSNYSTKKPELSNLCSEREKK